MLMRLAAAAAAAALLDADVGRHLFMGVLVVALSVLGVVVGAVGWAELQRCRGAPHPALRRTVALPPQHQRGGHERLSALDDDEAAARLPLPPSDDVKVEL